MNAAFPDYEFDVVNMEVFKSVELNEITTQIERTFKDAILNCTEVIMSVA